MKEINRTEVLDTFDVLHRVTGSSTFLSYLGRGMSNWVPNMSPFFVGVQAKAANNTEERAKYLLDVLLFYSHTILYKENNFCYNEKSRAQFNHINLRVYTTPILLGASFFRCT